MDVSCPKCGKSLPVDHNQADESGILRLQCFNCRKKLLLKLNRPDLKLGGDAGPAQPGLSLTDLAQKAAPKAGVNQKGVAAFWAAKVTEFPEESLSALRAMLGQIPRYSRNPNKIFDLIGDLPFVFTGLSHQEVSRLEACLQDCGATFRVGAEREVLKPEEESTASPDAPPPEIEDETEGEQEAEVVASPASSEQDSDAPAPLALPDEVLLLAVEVGPQIERWMDVLCQRIVLKTAPGTQPSSDEIHSAETEARELLRQAARELGADVILGLRSSLFTLADGSSMLQLEGNAAQRATPT